YASVTLWYQIISGGTQGYVRSDLIEKTDSTDAAAAQPTQTVSPTASGAEEQPETVMDLQYATVKATRANIRSKASKSAGTVDSMPQNTTLIISGQTNGSDGVWYYVTFTGTSGSEKSGYIRNDLITLGDMVPVEEPQVEDPETPAEEPQVAAPVVNQDYEVVYEDPNGEGYAWWLHDYTGVQATRVKVEEILQAVDAQKINGQIDAKTISKQRIAIVILVALVVILAVVLTFMFFKLRDAYIGEEEDESDNWKAERRIRENRENRDSRESREGRSTRSSSSGSSRSNASREEEPVRRRSASSDSQQPPVRKKPVDPERKAPAKEVTYEDDGTQRPKPAPKKKAKNFLADDDDFEFEFLNMKDKDKGED
ncbi:MAG: SH3 domain-containing protein, partial [Lachnospiraceae bacterium]|nr:SH3 domain-containing protein [Lachnospiraceae bacterium]